MIMSAIQIIGESQTLMSVLMRSLLEFPTTLSLEYLLPFYFRFEPEVKSNWGHVGVKGSR